MSVLRKSELNADVSKICRTNKLVFFEAKSLIYIYGNFELMFSMLFNEVVLLLYVDSLFPGYETFKEIVSAKYLETHLISVIVEIGKTFIFHTFFLLHFYSCAQ